tara:strand:- start:9 stop:539 length:531 start_codon:yes stop_codon:yes gene_type:complete
MNTADRSVEALDSALRRRFSFEEMMPNYEVIDSELKERTELETYPISKILKTINQRIEVLIDRDHTIGHSYFLSLKDAIDFEKELKSIFKDKIIPLLQEYFFNDYGKIQLVLGEGFVGQTSHDKNLFHKVEGNDIEVDEYLEKPNYTFTIESKKFELKDALNILLNGKKKKEKLDE